MRLLVAAVLALVRPALAEDAPAAPSFELVNGHLVLPGSIVFETGSAEILAESEQSLAHVLAFLAANRRTEFVACAMRGLAIGGMPLDGGGSPAGEPCPSE